MNPSPPSECLTPLDQKLQSLALTSWPDFVRLVGADAITRAKVCMLKRQEKSIRFISKKVGVTKSAAGRACKKCPE